MLFFDFGMLMFYLLSGVSIDYMCVFVFDYVVVYDLMFDGDVWVGVMLCVCVNVLVDFYVLEMVMVEIGGEFELF